MKKIDFSWFEAWFISKNTENIQSKFIFLGISGYVKMDDF